MVSIRFRIVSIAMLLLAIIAIATGWLDKRGFEYTEAGLQRALVTFGVSRALNGVISVAQGTEVAVEPVGIGMTFTPGQILDPINDLVERFSTVVLVAGTAFGAQRVLIEVTSAQFFSALCLTLAALSIVLMALWPRIKTQTSSFILRATLCLLFVRLAVPIFAIGGESFYQHFLAPQYLESSGELGSAAAKLAILNDEKSDKYATPQADKSFLDSARDWVNGASSNMDVKRQLEEFSAAAERVSLHAIRLMVVFVFQTLLLPILAIWLLLRGTQFCWRASWLDIPKS